MKIQNKPRKYTKRPVTISAMIFDGSNHVTISNFTNDAAKYNLSTNTLQIETLEGFLTVTPGDYVIKGIAGEFYPCKPDIFKDSYIECPDVSILDVLYYRKTVKSFGVISGGIVADVKLIIDGEETKQIVYFKSDYEYNEFVSRMSSLGTNAGQARAANYFKEKYLER